MNGVLKSQAEYYNDSVTYTGNAGSTTNMYVIEDVYDLCAAKIQSSYYELVNDIDFNDHDTYKYGVDSLIFGNTKSSYVCYLYGNNHKIRNLIIKNSSALAIFGGIISDIIFENLIVIDSTGGHLFYNYYSNTIKNVRIGGYLFNSASSVILSGNNTSFADCSFNLKGLTTDGINLYGSGLNAISRTYTRCHINCDITTTYADCMYLNFAILQDSYITGVIKQIGDLLYDDTNKTNRYIFAGTLQNSYVAVKATCETEEFTGYIVSLTANAVSFMDKKLVPIVEETAIDNWFYLTTEQATDPEYLLSINFPVVSVT